MEISVKKNVFKNLNEAKKLKKKKEEIKNNNKKLKRHHKKKKGRISPTKKEFSHS